MSAALGGHRRLDARSLALHRAIAGKLRSDPSLLAIAHDNLDGWSAQRGRAQPYWDVWRELLSRPLEEVLSVMVEDSEKMTAMRQASPFAGILTTQKRWGIYDQFPAHIP